MARVCQVTGKGVQSGNNVSHANNRTRRRWLPNLHERRFWVASENRWIKLRVSNNALRTMFSSCRTLPGQGCACRNSIASGWMEGSA